jgi:lipopolysaccharide transport system ATP-binding protein
LKDVSFEIERGAVLGIIGRNGGGKSTLLKVLSRVTEPTAGLADVYGRIGSLLEVGTGFHPELTGRENVYLNGAILGMKWAEIDRKFDEIIAFAQVENFIETPVKRYSSGMYLRLAFAVAAHLDLEILSLDEVLAVGDIAFQKKCLRKMREVARNGKTVLFVSHNLGAIKEICTTCIVLKSGQVDYQGPAAQAIAYYSQANAGQDEADTHDAEVVLSHLRINGQANGIYEPVLCGKAFDVEADLRVGEDLASASFYCVVFDSKGDGIVYHHADLEIFRRHDLRAGVYRIKARIPPLWLMPDAYTVYLKMDGDTKQGKLVYTRSERQLLDVIEPTGKSFGKEHAALFPPVDWSLDTTAERVEFPHDPQRVQDGHVLDATI